MKQCSHKDKPIVEMPIGKKKCTEKIIIKTFLENFRSFGN